MKPEFWREQWELNHIGFHQDQVHPLLIEHWSALGVEIGRVFVPLCGKSRDMAWLRRHGHSILGVELSPIAVTDFFMDRRLKPYIRTVTNFTLYDRRGFYMLCGDFFNLVPEFLERVKAIYDRAALIALPPSLQTRYAEHLLQLLPQRPPMLLITFEYDPEEMAGPPFPVTGQRVRELFGHIYQVETLASVDALESQPGLKSRGLSWLTEKVYRLHAETDVIT